MPEKLQELIEDYEVYVEQNGVIDLPADYNWAEEMTVNTIKRNYLPIIWRGILIVGIIIFAVVAVFLMRRQRNNVTTAGYSCLLSSLSVVLVRNVKLS